MSVETCSRPIVNSSELDFRPELLRPRYGRMIEDGKPTEEAREVIQNIFENDLKYMFWERFTKEKLVHYSYSFRDGKMVAPAYEKTGEDLCEILDAGVEDRKRLGESWTREEADRDGMEKLKAEFINSNRSQCALIISPPPPKAERDENCGYADYSFYYFGKYDPESKKLDMYGWRNEKSFAGQVNEAILLTSARRYSSSERSEVLEPNMRHPEFSSGSMFGILKQVQNDNQEFSTSSNNNNGFSHPNDFLRTPIFSDDFANFRRVIEEMPTEEEFDEAKNRDFSKYAEGVDGHARMLADMIADGADTSVLRVAQLKVETDFTRWIHGEELGSRVRPSNQPHLANTRDGPLSYDRFKHEVMDEYARFAVAYRDKLANSACGSCGNSVMSMFSSSSSFEPSLLMSASMPDMLPTYITCRCGESVKVGSAKCGNCGMTKAEYDKGETKAN